MSDVAKAAPQFIRRRVLHIVFASTSGHTEYVVEALIDSLKSITPDWEIEVTMAEKTQPQDLLGGDSPARIVDVEYREHRGAIQSAYLGAAP